MLTNTALRRLRLCIKSNKKIDKKIIEFIVEVCGVKWKAVEGE